MLIERKLDSRPSNLRRLSYAYGSAHHVHLYGQPGPVMQHGGKSYTVWCLNDYLGLMNLASAREAEGLAAREFGASYPHAARMTFGNTPEHEAMDKALASFSGKEDAMLMTLGYMGMVSIIDALLDRHDMLIYDQGIHACGIDGVRLHRGERFSFRHNDVAHLEAMLKAATEKLDPKRGSILVLVDGVYSMLGEQAPLAQIVALKSRYEFSVLVDDSHGFGVLGANGRGTAEAQRCEDGVDIFFSSFTKALGSLGGFIAARHSVIQHLRYNLRSHIFSRSMPLAILRGLAERFRVMRAEPQRRHTLWRNARQLQQGLADAGLDIGTPGGAITPVHLQGDEIAAIRLVEMLREDFGLFAYAVAYPVIQKGKVLVRLVPTAAHSAQQIEECIAAMSALPGMMPECFDRGTASVAAPQPSGVDELTKHVVLPERSQAIITAISNHAQALQTLRNSNAALEGTMRKQLGIRAAGG